MNLRKRVGPPPETGQGRQEKSIADDRRDRYAQAAIRAFVSADAQLSNRLLVGTRRARTRGGDVAARSERGACWRLLWALGDAKTRSAHESTGTGYRRWGCWLKPALRAVQ